MYNIKGNCLCHNNSVLLELKENILDFINDADRIYLITDSTASKNSQNVYCSNLNGNLKWIIEAVDPIHHDNYYTSIYLSDAGRLQAFNKNGIEVTIDKHTGRITEKELIK